ncbi:MAG: GatB/YqeY domain-containing protein [Clostridia bacterium]|nr:GatB/YqeY domain-containing protein [Clostridia bacterium]
MTFETLHNDMVAAMKARDKARKAVISTLIADVKKAAIDAGAREDISEALVDQVIQKSKKTAKEQLDSCPDERAELKAEYQYNYECFSERPSQILCKPPKQCRIKALQWRFNHGTKERQKPGRTGPTREDTRAAATGERGQHG